MVNDWGIYYDPDPNDTIIKDDQELLEIHRYVEDVDENKNNQERDISRWVLRFKMNSDPTQSIFNDYFEFKRDVVDRIDWACNQDPSNPII